MDAIDRSIVAGVERQADRVVRTVSELIGFPSIVPVGPAKAGPAERDCQLYLQSRLHDLGFRTALWDPDGPALFEKYQGRPGAHAGRTFEGRPILAGSLPGYGGGRSVMLTGHIDVVPPGATGQWRTDPFTATAQDGRLYGRGAADMKGGVACMLEAVAVMRELGIPLAGDIVFATVVDEEIGGPIVDLVEATKVMALAIRRWCA